MAMVQCFSGLLRHLCLRRSDVKPLPDDLVVEILSRLPAEDLVTCRKVCKRWRGLISTLQVAQLRGPPVIFLQCFEYGSGELEFFLLDRKRKETRIKRVDTSNLHSTRLHNARLIGSCNGLLLLMAPGYSPLFICNPLKGEELKLVQPDRCFPCGLFFHPSKKEFRLLCLRYEKTNSRYEYLITSIWNGWRQIGSTRYLPRDSDPAIVNGSLHWMAVQYGRFSHSVCSESIMVFDIEKEEFSLRGHPGPSCMHQDPLLAMQNMRLIEKEGSLSFFSTDIVEFGIWVLEDYANWTWVQKYQSRIPEILCRICPRDPRDIWFKPSNIQNEEMVVIVDDKDIFSYNPILNTPRELEIPVTSGKRRWLLLTNYTESPVTLGDLRSNAKFTSY